MKHPPVSYSKFNKELRRAGHSVTSINEIMGALRRTESPAEEVTRSHDWDFVLHPLKKQIKSMQSSKFKWSADARREPVFSMYLTLLLKVRARIESAQALNTAGLSIPAIAKQKGIGFQGMRWFAWVPDHVRAAVEKDFERLYHVTLPDAMNNGHIQAVGKRLVPFSTAHERSASGVRWMRMWSLLAAQLQERSAYPGQEVLIHALREALHVVNNHDARRDAPTNWEHLLSERTSEELRLWRGLTLNGLADSGPPAEEISATPAPITMKGLNKASISAQKYDLRKKAMREYAAKRRKAQGVVPRKAPIQQERVANDKAPVTTPQPPAGTRAWVDWVNERRVAMGNEPWTYAEHVTVREDDHE